MNHLLHNRLRTPESDAQKHFDAIIAQPQYEAVPIIPTIQTLPITEPMTAAAMRIIRAEESDTGEPEIVVQQLHGVVKSEESLYGIVKVTLGIADREHFIITRFSKPGERAAIEAVLEPWLPEIPGGSMVSPKSRGGDTFNIGVLGKDRIVIGDHERSDRTQLVRVGSGQAQESVDQPGGSRLGLLGAVSRRIAEHRSLKPVPGNPLRDHKLWSAVSADVKKAIEQSL